LPRCPSRHSLAKHAFVCTPPGLRAIAIAAVFIEKSESAYWTVVQ
jgi:hypothetical protein